MHLAALGHPILRYEDRFFDQPQTVALIGRWLWQTLSPSAIETISDRYSTETVRDLAAQVPTRPPDRMRAVAGRHIDRLTQLHSAHIGSAHIGDTMSGKWSGCPHRCRQR